MGAADKVASGPPPAATSTQRKSPVGVPDDYIAAGRRSIFGVSIPAPVPARYTDDHIWQPASLPPEIREQIQADLWAAGLLTEDDEFTRGAWDPTTRKAYSEVLAFANASGLRIDEALAEMTRITAETAGPGRGGRGGGSRGPKRAPLTVELPNPADISAGIDDTARQEIGKVLQQPDVQRYVADYNQLLTRHQQQTYNAAETGGTVTAAPSLEAFTQERLKTEQPTEVFNTDLLDSFNTLTQMIGTLRTS